MRWLLRWIAGERGEGSKGFACRCGAFTTPGRGSSRMLKRQPALRQQARSRASMRASSSGRSGSGTAPPTPRSSQLVGILQPRALRWPRHGPALAAGVQEARTPGAQRQPRGHRRRRSPALHCLGRICAKDQAADARHDLRVSGPRAARFASGPDPADDCRGAIAQRLSCDDLDREPCLRAASRRRLGAGASNRQFHAGSATAGEPRSGALASRNGPFRARRFRVAGADHVRQRPARGIR